MKPQEDSCAEAKGITSPIHSRRKWDPGNKKLGAWYNVSLDNLNMWKWANMQERETIETQEIKLYKKINVIKAYILAFH